MLGKQIVLNHALQYVGSSLSKDDIGKIIKNMPFANIDETFDDLTIDYDNAKNDVLALDRGEMPIFNEKDNHSYVIKKLVHRMKCADYQLLSDEIKHNYETFLQVHVQLEAVEQQKIQMAQSGFIPTGGYMVKADFYTTDVDGKTKRAIFPYESLAWLSKKLEQQGMGQADIASMQSSAQADVADKLAGLNAQNNSVIDPAQMGGMQNVS